GSGSYIEPIEWSVRSSKTTLVFFVGFLIVLIATPILASKVVVEIVLPVIPEISKPVCDAFPYALYPRFRVAQRGPQVAVPGQLLRNVQPTTTLKEPNESCGPNFPGTDLLGYSSPRSAASDNSVH